MATSPFDQACFGIQRSMISLPSSALFQEKRSNSPPEHPVPRTDPWTVTYWSSKCEVSWRLSPWGAGSGMPFSLASVPPWADAPS